MNSKEWITNCLYLTTSNDERILLNSRLSTMYAVVTGKVVIKYPLRILTCPDECSLPNDMSHEQWRVEMRSKYPELWGYFIMGGPAALTCNFKPELKLSNGSQVTLSGLIFDESNSLYAKAKTQIDNASPGSLVTIELAPQYILVEAETPSIQLNEEEIVSSVAPLDSKKTVFVIPAESQKPMKVKNAITHDRLFNLEYKASFVDLLFACTYHKAQR